MAALLALASSLVYGSGDFLGGMASRRAPAILVTIWAQLIGLVGLAVAVVVLPADDVTAADMAWGGVAGCGGAMGLLLLYGALGDGTMSVVAPLSAVWSAVVPVGFGLTTGERPSGLALVGVALALFAIALVGAESESAGRVTRRTLLRALGAGTGFGLYFVLLAQTDKDAGVWPLIPGRMTGVVLLVVVALAGHRLTALPRPVWRLTAACGVCDSTANVLYILAAQRGLLSLVAVLTALYPASTVLLARVVLKERLGRRQLAGLAVALAAVTLVAAGS